MTADAIITIEHLTKKYKKYTVPINSLKSFVLHYGEYRREREKVDELVVIEDLNLQIRKSDIFCIAGFNGAGKSTLAKMIAGTTPPTSGQISVRGRIVPFLELGVAFNTELSGRDNVYLNGVLLGLSLAYIKKNMDAIFSYAEIEDFIDTPLKYYSSGMQMRLAFSIGMHANGDIYIFDEILAVGDMDFQQKCANTFANLIADGKTIIVITHAWEFIQQYATRLLFLHEGKSVILDTKEKILQTNLDELRLIADNQT